MNRGNKDTGMPHSAPAPVFFLSHGAPTFALEPGELGPGLQRLGESLAGARAVLVVSAHWQTRDVRVMTSAAPPTMYDFFGFPAALNALKYAAPGAPAVAAETARLLVQAGYAVSDDDQRGLDHGAWVPLRFLLPHAELPVFQVSMPRTLDTTGALRLGRALAPLRERGVVIVGSGSLTHNLAEFAEHVVPPAPYARDFAAWIGQAVLRRDVAALSAYRSQAPQAERAHPTEEHFLPLLLAYGASDAADRATLIAGGITHGVLSMDGFAWGLPRH